MDKIAIIITTRLYPDVSDTGWGKAFSVSDIQKEDLDNSIREDEDTPFYKNQSVEVLANAFPGQAGSNAIEFSVYVAPCLNAEITEGMKAKKAFYLERLVEKVVEKEKESKLFLVAHDKDFCVEKSDIVVTEDMISKKEDYPKLRSLVEKQRVYLFQHDSTSNVYQLVQKLDTGDFEYDDCTKMLKVITLLVEMMNQFKEVDEDAKSYYQS